MMTMMHNVNKIELGKTYDARIWLSDTYEDGGLCIGYKVYGENFTAYPEEKYCFSGPYADNYMKKLTRLFRASGIPELENIDLEEYRNNINIREKLKNIVWFYLVNSKITFTRYEYRNTGNYYNVVKFKKKEVAI